MPPPCAGTSPDVACPSLFANWIEAARRRRDHGRLRRRPSTVRETSCRRDQMAAFLLKAEARLHLLASPPPVPGRFLDVPRPPLAVRRMGRAARRGEHHGRLLAAGTCTARRTRTRAARWRCSSRRPSISDVTTRPASNIRVTAEAIGGLQPPLGSALATAGGLPSVDGSSRRPSICGDDGRRPNLRRNGLELAGGLGIERAAGGEVPVLGFALDVPAVRVGRVARGRTRRAELSSRRARPRIARALAGSSAAIDEHGERTPGDPSSPRRDPPRSRRA